MRMTETRVMDDGLDGLFQRFFRLFELIPYSILAFGARFAVGLFFFRSALTRVDQKFDLTKFAVITETEKVQASALSIPLPWTIKGNQGFVFAEYKYFGFEMPEWFHNITMHPVVWAESILPIFLMIGLAARFSAAGLCLMALMIGLVIYPQFFTKETLAIAVLAAMVMKGGPGVISIDALIRRVRWSNV